MELVIPASAVRHASVARHVTDCAIRPGVSASCLITLYIGDFSPKQLMHTNWNCLSEVVPISIHKMFGEKISVIIINIYLGFLSCYFEIFYEEDNSL